MTPAIPTSIGLVIATTACAIAAATWVVISMGAGRSGLPKAEQRRVRTATAGFLAAWVATAFWFAPDPGSLRVADGFRITPLIPSLGITAVAVAIFAIWRWMPLRRALSCVPTPALHALQTWRVVGVVFVVLFTSGYLPAHFALPAGWGDIFVGLTAPLVALALARGARGAVALATLWNLLGVLDLVVAIGMGTGALAPFLAPELGPRVPPVAAMGAYPLILVPAFAVPVSGLVHGLSMARLVHDIRPQRRLASTPAQ